MTVGSRRKFLGTLGGASAVLIFAPSIIARAALGTWKSNPFTLGVASGAPRPDGFVLWTRLAPDPLDDNRETPGGMSGGNVEIAYEISHDPKMQRILHRGVAIAEKTYAYSVHCDVRGLPPGRPYWYRFMAGDAVSPIGRAMTLPARGAHIDRLRFAYFSCSNYEHGYFSAYRHAADEEPDLAIFLGDYIYEYIDTKHSLVRRHSGGAESRTLAQYRNRYAQYRTDPDLQQIHAVCPSLITWDDHEVQNDYADKWSQTFDDPLDFYVRRAAAYQAFYEHMPVPPQHAPHGPAMQVYGRHEIGDLLTLNMLDGRQYRSREACYGKPDKGRGHLESDASCPERLDAARSLLGQKQENWLFASLAKSRTRWNILAQDVMMAQFKQKNKSGEVQFWTDDWNGYPQGRARVLQHIHDSRVPNPVVITGDIHSFWANDLKLGDADSAPVAAELIGTSVSAIAPDYDTFAAFLPDNPHVKFFESRKRGYVSVELSSDRLLAHFRTVSDVTASDASVDTLSSFTVESGRPGIAPA